MSKQEIQVLNKIKKTCLEAENCETCKYHDYVWRCVFNREFPADWIIEGDE